MSSIARKLVLSVVAVLLSVLAFGTTTFAWFTITNVSEVQPFESEIVTDNGIEVSLDGITWVTSLTTEMIDAYIAAQYPGFAFNHVTTTTGHSNFLTLGTSGVTEAGTASVLSLNLMFRSNNANAVKWTGVSLSGTSASWISDVSFTRSSNLPEGAPVLSAGLVTVNPANAMRISILGNHLSDAVVVYENPAGDYDGAYNTVLGGDVLLTPVDFSDGVGVGLGDPGSYNYYYVKTDALITGTNAVVTAASITAVDNNINARLVLHMTANSLYSTTYWGQISIRIWFEGWDAEAYNSLLGRMITTSFIFEGASV